MSRVINPPPHLYASHGLDRAAHLRRDDAWQGERLGDPRTRVLPMFGLKVLADLESEPRLAWLPPGDIPDVETFQPLFLGLHDNRAHFAVEAEGQDRGHLDYVEVRSIGRDIARIDAGMAAYARALVHWRAKHLHCGACGRMTRPTEGGHARHCDGCGLDSFPRTDPAVIVLVSDGDRCVLGRSARIPAGIYSTLAGFMEPGESMEQTVAREVFEEVGIEVDTVRYRSSQPWPFPQSLMLGFQATARYQPLKLQEDEIEDARWFTREELLDPGKRPVQLPNTDSIARFLIEEWLMGEV